MKRFFTKVCGLFKVTVGLFQETSCCRLFKNAIFQCCEQCTTNRFKFMSILMALQAELYEMNVKLWKNYI